MVEAVGSSVTVKPYHCQHKMAYRVGSEKLFRREADSI